MRIAIIGVGAVGCLIAARISSAEHQVTLIARNTAAVRTIRRDARRNLLRHRFVHLAQGRVALARLQRLQQRVSEQVDRHGLFRLQHWP